MNNDPETFEYRQLEASQKAKMPPLSLQNLRDKEKYEERMFIRFRRFFNTNFGDNDTGYATVGDE